jgi:hypothetical protein
MRFLAHTIKTASVSWTNQPLYLPEGLCSVAEQLKPSFWDKFFSYRNAQREQLLRLSSYYEQLHQAQTILSQAQPSAQKPLRQAIKALNNLKAFQATPKPLQSWFNQRLGRTTQAKIQTTVSTWLTQTEQALIQQAQAELIAYTDTKIHSLPSKRTYALNLVRGYNKSGWRNTLYQETYNVLLRCGSAVSRIAHSSATQAAVEFKTIHDLQVDIQTSFERLKANVSSPMATPMALLQYYRSILHRIAETIGGRKAYLDYPRALRQELIQQLKATLLHITDMNHLSYHEKQGLVKLTQRTIAFLELPSPNKTLRTLEAHESPLLNLHFLKANEHAIKPLQHNLLADINAENNTDLAMRMTHIK